MIQYQDQEIKNPQAHNLLEDSDQDSAKKKPPIDSNKEKASSNFRFIATNNRENPNQSLISEAINNKAFTNQTVNVAPPIQTTPIQINPQLASIDFNMSYDHPKTIPTYNNNINNNMNISQAPQGKPNNMNNNKSNYNVLDSIQQPRMPFYDYPMRGFIVQPQQTPQMNMKFNVNNGNGKPPQKKEDKESAFDFVNDLVNLK